MSGYEADVHLYLLVGLHVACLRLIPVTEPLHNPLASTQKRSIAHIGKWLNGSCLRV